MQDHSLLRRLMYIPPDLRAMACAIANTDPSQLPLDAYMGQVHPRSIHRLEALDTISCAIRDGEALSTSELYLLRAAVLAGRQHLHGVTPSMMATNSPYSRVLTLTTQMDSFCTEHGIAIGSVLPSLRVVHDYFVSIVENRDLQQRQDAVLDRLLHFTCDTLQRGLETLSRVKDAMMEAPREMSPPMQHSARDGTPIGSCPAGPLSDRHSDSERRSRLDSGHGRRARRSTFNVEKACPQVSWPTPSSRERRRTTIINTNELETGVVSSLPTDLAETISSVNADLSVNLAHLQWLITTVSHGASSINSDDYLDDAAMRKVWTTYVGRSTPACCSEEFQDALLMFPQWSWKPIMEIVNYQGCGVVSLFSVQKLLKIWGPLPMLDGNLREDCSSGVFCISQSFEYLLPVFALRPKARAGDYVVSLSATPGEAQIIVLSRARQNQGRPGEVKQPTVSPERRISRRSNGSLRAIGSPRRSVSFADGSWRVEDEEEDDSTPLVSHHYRLTQETGAWTMPGLTREEFESVTEACRAFPDIFKYPQGQRVAEAVKKSLSSPTRHSLRSSRRISAQAGTCSEFSALHRACFRNNTRYVRTLLKRGASTIINTAVVDPLVTSEYCWTPLLCAVNNPNSDPAEVVQLLLEAGADAHYADEAECTSLYYAVANGYAGATRALLQHCPSLESSPSTIPLLVALGAHPYHLRECDIRRLMDVIPSKEVLEAIMPSITQLELITLGLDLLHEKLDGVDREMTAEQYHRLMAIHGMRGAAPELRTAEEMAVLRRLQRYHTQLCQRNRMEVYAAMRVLCNRCYVLSWHAWLRELEEDRQEVEEEPHSTSISGPTLNISCLEVSECPAE